MTKFVRWCVYFSAFLTSITAVRALERNAFETAAGADSATYLQINETLTVVLAVGTATFFLIGIAELIASLGKKRTGAT
jgi:hypothetical protein